MLDGSKERVSFSMLATLSQPSQSRSALGEKIRIPIQGRSKLREVELLVHPGTQRGDKRLDLVVLQHAVDPGLLDVQDLAANRQDGLGSRVAAIARTTACGVTLYNEDLAVFGIVRRAVD